MDLPPQRKLRDVSGYCVVSEDVCIRDCYLKQKPEYIFIVLHTLQAYVVVAPKLISPVHSAHVLIVYHHTLGEWYHRRRPILLPSLDHGGGIQLTHRCCTHTHARIHTHAHRQHPCLTGYGLVLPSCDNKIPTLPESNSPCFILDAP